MHNSCPAISMKVQLWLKAGGKSLAAAFVLLFAYNVDPGKALKYTEFASVGADGITYHPTAAFLFNELEQLRIRGRPFTSERSCCSSLNKANRQAAVASCVMPAPIETNSLYLHPSSGSTYKQILAQKLQQRICQLHSAIAAPSC
jgi:hypothetical protein